MFKFTIYSVKSGYKDDQLMKLVVNIDSTLLQLDTPDLNGSYVTYTGN